ncbi:MAG TPA: nuclear transport factor 2 family protein, partial [Cryomorphaceae bacterium]|nr:nuclear transport factor 2 family protein [Cryomorphaceae bacterium]
TRQYICPEQGAKPIRKRDENSLEVFPLYKDGKLYGAIQNGVHRFYLRETGKEDVLTGTARFSHVWLLQGDQWKLSVVLSYDH